MTFGEMWFQIQIQAFSRLVLQVDYTIPQLVFFGLAREIMILP
jgi:hypothetical protein